MLLARANVLVNAGRARIVNGRVRILKVFNPTDAGYERARGFVRVGGSLSFDPDMGGGPQVMQFHRGNKGRRGAA